MRVNGEATAADVLALWDQSAALDPSDFWTHIYRARLARTLNRLDAALSAARAASDATTDRRERTAATDEIGDVLIARNDLEGALTNYREGLELRRALYAADRSNAERARDVSVSLNKIGDVLIARNDLEGALTNYREGLEIARALYAADRSNAERARDVAVSLQRTGMVSHLMGDNRIARRDWEEALQIVDRLNTMGSGNATFARDVQQTRALLARLSAAPAQ